MGTPNHRLFAPLLLMMLIAPWALSIAGVVPNDVRIDSAAEPPGFQPSRLLDADYYRELDDQLATRFPGRGAGRWLQVQIDYELFGQVVHPDVERGPGDWLQRSVSVHPPCEVLARIGDRTVDESLYGRVTFAVFATKSDVHPQSTYPADIDPCVWEERRAWKARTATMPEYLDVNDVLTDAAAAGDDLLFYEQDMHWTQTARLLVAQAVVNDFSPGLWDPDAVTPVEPTLRDMDVLRQMGLKRSGILVDRAVRRDGEVQVDRINFVTSQSAYFPLVQISRSTAAQVVPGTTWIIGDSQSGYLLYELEPYFEELVFVNALQMLLGPEVILELPDPDRVMITSIELMAPGLFGLPLVDEVIARLPQ